MKEILTAKQVQHMKPTGRQTEVPAGPPRGLYLVLHPGGRKTWRFRYRYRGRTRGLMFPKPYAEMTLAAARAEAESCLDKLKEGIDPAAAQAEEIKQETPESAKAVAHEWIKRYVKINVGNRSQDEYERILNKEVLPLWKDKLITEIGKPDVLCVIDTLVDRGTPALANKTLAIIKAWMDWAVTDRGYIDISPAANIRLPSKPVSRERVLEPSELLEVWNATETLGYPIGLFTQLLILTAQRRGEVATMQATEIDFDKALWSIPAEKSKGGRVHLVPLSRPALKILENLPTFTKGNYLWTTTSGAKPINGFSKAKDHLDDAILDRRNEAGIKESIPGWTMHDLRRTGATLMAKARVLPHVLSAILGHSTSVSVVSMPTAAVTKVYNRYAYLDEKRAALEDWAKYVFSLTGKKAAAKAAKPS